MLVSINWLKDYADIQVPVDEFCDRMILSGSNIETVEPYGTKFSKIVVGRILKIEQDVDKRQHHNCATDVCAMEVSSHSLALSRTDDISFDYGVFTNLTPDHMDFHKDFEDYFNAKKKLFLQTVKGNVINVDDSYGKRLYEELSAEGRPVKSCAVADSGAYYRAHILEKSVAGTRAEIFAGEQKLGELKINTPGMFSVENAIGAVGVTLEAGIPWDAVKAGIEKTRGVAGRFESVENSRGIPVIVDYAHTPDALENVLKTAREFTENRIITVFGCGGDRDRTKRPLMGEIAGKYSDYCVVTSDNPRTEDPEKILEDIVPGIEPTGCEYTVIEDRRRAIKKAVTQYQPGDVVIIEMCIRDRVEGRCILPIRLGGNRCRIMSKFES